MLALAACGRTFELQNYPTPEGLFQASLAELQRKHWDNAVKGFENLTLTLNPRDTLLSRAQYYLGMAHRGRGEDLLAAQALVRVVESFPNDTLADEALYEAARAYQRMWKKPELDSQYGSSALETYRLLQSSYPDSPLAPAADTAVARLEEWFARKDFENGMHYLRRKAYDPAIIYFKDVVERYPRTDAARRSQLRMLESYRKMNYREEATELCATLRQTYPTDGEVRESCGAPPPVTAADSSP